MTTEKDSRFYAPSQVETESILSTQQLADCKELAASLQASYGPVSDDFYLPGWVWVQTALAQHNGITDHELITRALDELYNELLDHLSATKND